MIYLNRCNTNRILITYNVCDPTQMVGVIQICLYEYTLNVNKLLSCDKWRKHINGANIEHTIQYKTQNIN